MNPEGSGIAAYVSPNPVFTTLLRALQIYADRGSVPYEVARFTAVSLGAYTPFREKYGFPRETREPAYGEFVEWLREECIAF